MLRIRSATFWLLRYESRFANISNKNWIHFFYLQDSTKSEKEPKNFIISEWSHQVSAYRKQNKIFIKQVLCMYPDQRQKELILPQASFSSYLIHQNLNFLLSMDLIKLEWGFVFPRIPPPPQIFQLIKPLTNKTIILDNHE